MKSKKGARREGRQRRSKSQQEGGHSGGAGGAPAKKTDATFLGIPSARLEKCFPYFVVLLCCALYALQLGVQQPFFSYQVAGEQVFAYEGCNASSSPDYAYASGKQALLFFPEGKNSIGSAGFAGAGGAGGVLIESIGSGSLHVAKLTVNGEDACAPCQAGREYPLRADVNSGKLEVLIEVEKKELEWNQRGGPAFFKERPLSAIEAPVLLSFSGGWAAKPNAAMPSSFYGIDAPFHIRKIRETAGSLMNGKFPESQYPVLSSLPGALIHLTIAQPPEYAYKVLEIILFFFPILLFFLFSRKLSSWRGAAFLFASLLYLYLPAMGYPTGGGADLFMYGMTAHTLATYFSLVFVFFAYGAVFEGKDSQGALAVVFFFLACSSNPRIIFSLALVFFVICASALAMARARRAAALGALCALSVSLLYFSFSQSTAFAAYGVLEGAGIENAGEGLLAFLQAGYFVLPVLAVAGAYAAYRRKDLFPVILAAGALAVLLAATNPGMNRAFPFLDGLRFLPSFFLPVFFVSGMGACYLFEKFAAAARSLGGRLKLDRATVSVALALAIFVPFAVFFLAVMGATSSQYSSQASSLHAVSEYSWLDRAFAKAGNSTVIYVSGGYVSQYPVFDRKEGRTVSKGYAGAGWLYNLSQREGATYVIFGNRWALENESAESLADAYSEAAHDGRFSEAIGFGAGRMLEVRGGSPD